MARTGRKPHKGLEILANQTLTEVPEPPQDFTKEEAKRFYTYAGELVQRGILFPTDLYSVEALVRLETEAAKLLAEIAKDGALYEDKNQDKRRSPAVMAYGNISTEIGNLRKLLALGPVYRNKLPGTESNNAGKDRHLLNLEKRIKAEHTPQDAATLIKALSSNSIMALRVPRHLSEPLRKYREDLVNDREFDI